MRSGQETAAQATTYYSIIVTVETTELESLKQQSKSCSHIYGRKFGMQVSTKTYKLTTLYSFVVNLLQLLNEREICMKNDYIIEYFLLLVI